MELALRARTAIVTGGTRNLGRAIVEGLLNEGANVITAFRSDVNAAAAFEASLPSPLRERLRVYQLDLASSPACQTLVGHAVTEFGGLHILVNNAGVMLRQDPQAIADHDFDWMLRNTLRSFIYMTRAAFAVMSEGGGGRVVNLSSEAAHTGNPKELTYLCAKAGVEGATRAFARLGAPHGLTVNAVAAHVVHSGMGTDTLADDSTIVSRIPLGRAGRLPELVSLVLFLCSDVCQYLTGQTLHLNGGRILHG